MSKRKTYGNILFGAGLVLGVLLLIGSFMWMQDKANMLLAVFVLILYGVGQWVTIIYWQRIQADWESTGETLARLQQAVTDIPTALDSNLKAIAVRLAEGQQKALSELQAQVNEGARQVLDKGLGMLAGQVDGLVSAQREAAAQARSLTESVSSEMKSLAGSVGGELKTLAASVAGEVKALASAQSKAGEDARAAWAQEAKQVGEAIAKTLAGSAASFEEGVRKVREASQQLVSAVETRAAQDQAALVKQLSEAQAKALAEAGRSLEAQGRMGVEMAEKVADLAGRMAQGSKDFQELASLSRINQAEMQAGIGMLNAGLASILDRLDKQASAGEGYQAFLSEMGKALAAFQERAGEALMENSLKTQEILLEVLNQAEGRSAGAAEPSAAALN